MDGFLAGPPLEVVIGFFAVADEGAVERRAGFGPTSVGGSVPRPDTGHGS